MNEDDRPVMSLAEKAGLLLGLGQILYVNVESRQLNYRWCIGGPSSNDKDAAGRLYVGCCCTYSTSMDLKRSDGPSPLATLTLPNLGKNKQCQLRSRLLSPSRSYEAFPSTTIKLRRSSAPPRCHPTHRRARPRAGRLSTSRSRCRRRCFTPAPPTTCTARPARRRTTTMPSFLRRRRRRAVRARTRCHPAPLTCPMCLPM